MIQITQYPPESACCTCATLLSNVVGYPPHSNSIDYNEKDAYIFSEKDEKHGHEQEEQKHSQTECCGRYICSVCTENNPRFATYCPFCPSRSASSSKPTVQDSTLPPSYSTTQTPVDPPSYEFSTHQPAQSINPSSESIIHHLHPTDTLPVLSLRYTTPLPLLRQHNRIFSDSLLHGRTSILIPRSHYQGPSLSPDPIQTEEESILKRFQKTTKCVEYDVAKVYLDAAGGDLEKAVGRWEEDERWEAEQDNGKGKGTTGKKGSAREAQMGMVGRRIGFFR